MMFQSPVGVNTGPAGAANMNQQLKQLRDDQIRAHQTGHGLNYIKPRTQQPMGYPSAMPAPYTQTPRSSFTNLPQQPSAPQPTPPSQWNITTGITPQNIIPREAVTQTHQNLAQAKSPFQAPNGLASQLNQLVGQSQNDAATNYLRTAYPANVQNLYQGNVAQAQAGNQWADLMTRQRGMELGNQLSRGESLFGLLSALIGGL